MGTEKQVGAQDAQAGSPEANGSEATPWFVRMIEGMRRDTYGIFVDESTRPIIKSKNKAELQRVADAHNKTLPPNAPAHRPAREQE